MYERSVSTSIEPVDGWSDGVGWVAHPEEGARRTSHAIRGDDGTWVFDPLDGPGVDDCIAELGSVAGVAVLSPYHARDATRLAERHDVSVHLPAWMDRAAERVDAPVERYEAPPGEWVDLAGSGISVRTVDPVTAWREAIAYRPADGTLRVPDMFLTLPAMTVGSERLGYHLFHRFAPPRTPFADIDPVRVLVGHGDGVTENAGEALEHALDSARRNVPRALLGQAPTQFRSMLGVLRD